MAAGQRKVIATPNHRIGALVEGGYAQDVLLGTFVMLGGALALYYA